MTSVFSVFLTAAKPSQNIVPAGNRRTEVLVTANEDCSVMIGRQTRPRGTRYPLVANVPTRIVLEAESAMSGIREGADVTITAMYWLDGSELIAEAIRELAARTGGPR